jgi:hypothetical protein
MLVAPAVYQHSIEYLVGVSGAFTFAVGIEAA